MKIIDLAAEQQTGSPLQNALSGALSKAQGLLPAAPAKKAQDVMVQNLERTLDGRFVLLRNLILPGDKLPMPLILVGPHGVLLINASGQTGIFRAKDGDWLELNKQTNQYKPAQRNLIAETQAYARILEKYLEKKHLEGLEVQSVLFFSLPGIDVEASRPAVRVLRLDAFDRFIAPLVTSDPVLAPNDISQVVNGLTASELPASPSEDPAPVSSRPSARPKPAAPARKAAPKAATRLATQVTKVRFSRQQLIILGVMAGLCVLALIAVIFFLVLTV